MEKEMLVSQVAALQAAGASLRKACEAAGVSPANVLRWQRELAEPEREKSRGGRPAKWTLAEGDRQRLRWLMAKTGSLPLTVEYFVRWYRTGACELPIAAGAMARCAALASVPGAELALALSSLMDRGGHWEKSLPKSLRQAVSLTKLERAEVLGERSANNEAFKAQRVMAIRELDALTGESVLRQIVAGMGFCSDDMSINEPFRHAEGIGRQTLSTMDVYSRRWLGVYLIGRRGDAYTALDIADHFYSVVKAVGLPYFWQLERGPWENDFINGCAVPAAWGDAGGLRWGGLEKCFASGPLFRVSRKFNPQGKVIEGGYNYLQSRMAGRATGVGRKRGQYEAAGRLIQRAKEGNEEAASILWGACEGVEALWQQMLADNAREKKRAFLGGDKAAPDMLWRETFRGRALPSGDAWRFTHPIKRDTVTRAQSVFISLKGYGPLPFQFRVCGDDLPWSTLDNGHRVFVAFHPDRPERGAVIANGDTRAAYNRRGWKFGAMLGIAPYVPPVPMEDFTGEGDFSHAGAARRAIRGEIRAGGIGDAGIVRVSRAADALGHALEVSNQPEPESPARLWRGNARTEDESITAMLERMQRMTISDEAEAFAD